MQFAANTVPLLDFHSHYYDTAWFSSAAVQPATGPLKQAWRLLSSIEAQLAAMDEAGIDAKVLSAPTAVLTAPGQSLSQTQIRRINDQFAHMVERTPERLLALATIDAFQGEAAAHEVERAIQELHLHGICVDCAQGNAFLDDPRARPTLDVAAALDIPVFVHPVSPAGFTEHLSPLGHTGILVARGTENAASLLALLRSDILTRLPTLKLVFPFIGVAALFFAGIAEQEYQREEGWRGPSPAQSRKMLYIDTMGFDPASVRFALQLLGPDHVLLGSDWPIMPIRTRAQLEQFCAQLELTEQQSAALLSGNALRLFKIQAS